MTPGESSVPKIQVGGNFKIGNVPGQAAIGENIAQIVCKDCTFILPDGSYVHGKSWLYTQGIRPTTDPANIFGRQQELNEIDEFFKDSSALVITGFRGTGKSTLASMYIDRLEKRGIYAGIYWRRVDETIDISDVVGSFFTVIGKPIKDLAQYKIGDQFNLLFRELNAAPYFLVLDNFEILLNSQTNVPLKPGFSDLIEKATESTGKSQILFTSWEYPASERGIRPKCYPIGGLDESAAIQLLRRNGLTEPGNGIKKAIELSGGHPLALILLVQLVKEGAETLSSILADNALWLGEKGEVAERILDKVYTERLNPEERRMLQYLSLFREPIPSRAIAAIANDPGWTEPVIKNLALTLNRKSLLQKTNENYWEEPLIQNYMYIKIFDKVKRHKFAYQYYFSLPLSEKLSRKEDIQPLLEAHYHACMAKEYDKAANIIFDYKLNEDLEKWGNYRTLVDLYERILPKDHLKDDPILSDIQIHGHVLGSAGIAYQVLGEARKAISYYEEALKIAQVIGDRRNEGTKFGNIGNAYSDLGDKRKAIEYYERARKIANENGDRRNEGIWFGNIGTAYSALGAVRKAIEYYGKAYGIALEIGDKRCEGTLLGNFGNAYHNLGEKRKAIGYYEKALKIAQEIGDKRNEGGILGNLGSAYRNLGEVRKAIACYEKALVITQEIEDRQGEATWIGNLGNIYRNLREVKKAIEFYGEALNISQEIGDRQGEGAWLGGLGNVCRDINEIEKAIEYYSKALKITREIGDRGNEGVYLNNLGDIFRNKKKYEEALAFYLLAKDIFTQIEDPDLLATESNLKNLKKELGENEFEKLVIEVKPRAEEIIKKILEEI